MPQTGEDIDLLTYLNAMKHVAPSQQIEKTYKHRILKIPNSMWHMTYVFEKYVKSKTHKTP